MSRLIDCEKIRKPIYAEEDNITGIGMTYEEIEVYNAAIDEFFNRIKNAPTVDAVSVVRCKDCKHYDHKEGTGWCDLNSFMYLSGGDWNSFDEDDFCSKGERKEDENTGEN